LNRLNLDVATATGWPEVRATIGSHSTVGDLVRKMRNAFAHGNIDFLAGPRGEISALRIWNSPPHNSGKTWEALLTVFEMRSFLMCFVQLAKSLHGKAEQPRIA